MQVRLFNKFVGNLNFGLGGRPLASIFSLAYIAVVLSFFDTLRYRFAEIYYRRGESSSHKGRGMRVETVVLFVPDVWSCLPTRVEWEGMIAAGSCKNPLLQQKHLEEMMEPEAQALTHYLVSFLFTILLFCRDCATPHLHQFLVSYNLFFLFSSLKFVIPKLLQNYLQIQTYFAQ